MGGWVGGSVGVVFKWGGVFYMMALFLSLAQYVVSPVYRPTLEVFEYEPTHLFAVVRTAVLLWHMAGGLVGRLVDGWVCRVARWWVFSCVLGVALLFIFLVAIICFSSLMCCCCSRINSHNQVRGHKTGSSHSGAEEYPRGKNKHKRTKRDTRIYHS